MIKLFPENFRDRAIKYLVAFYSVAILSSCISCSSFSALDINNIDFEFDEEVSAYIDLKKKYLKTTMNDRITILFHSLERQNIGVCYIFGNGDIESPVLNSSMNCSSTVWNL